MIQFAITIIQDIFFYILQNILYLFISFVKSDPNKTRHCLLLLFESIQNIFTQLVRLLQKKPFSPINYLISRWCDQIITNIFVKKMFTEETD